VAKHPAADTAAKHAEEAHKHASEAVQHSETARQPRPSRTDLPPEASGLDQNPQQQPPNRPQR